MGASSGQLRALPLLRALGLKRFTFTNHWRGLNLVPFDWRRIVEDTMPAELVGDLPIGQFLSQRTEDASPGDAARVLLWARDAAGPETLLVYVLESETFTTRRGPQQRPFVDEYALSAVFPYPTVAASFAQRAQFGEAVFSRNLAWWGLDRFVLRGVVVRSLADLLDVEQHRSDSPLWDLYGHLCDLVTPDGGGVDRVGAALHPWLDDDIGRVTNRVLERLQRYGFRRTWIDLARQESDRDA